MSTKDWVKVSIFGREACVDLMAHVLFEHGAQGVVVGENWVAAYFATVIPWQERLAAIESTVAALSDDGGWGECRVTGELVDDEDWTTNWRRHFRPFRVGEQLVVVPTWQDYATSPDDLTIRLDPALAFGSGEHPTTRMALVALEELVTGGMTVIDVGTGSGILAIAAARLGAERVWAVDTDAASVHAARANVIANALEDKITVALGTLTDLPPDPVDLLVANIVAGTIIKLAPQVVQYLRPTGWLLAGGIIDKRLGDVVAALEQAGLSIVQVIRQEDWVTVCATPEEGVHWREDLHAPYLCSSRTANR